MKRLSSSRLFVAVMALLPVAVWLYVFRPFWAGQAVITSECFSQYATIKFYLDQMCQGVFPLWNPFLYWGSPTAVSLSSVAFNPLWLMILPFEAAGLGFYAAFLCVYTGYFFVGMTGFYLLAKAWTRDRLAAYAAVLLLMFSGMALPFFTQQGVLLLFVPMVWFFYFFLGWQDRQEPRFLIGMTFALMMVLAEYLPFYFTTVLLIAGIIAVVFYPGRSLRTAAAFARFAGRRPGLTVICLLALGTALVPGLRAYQATRAQEVLVPTRHQGDDHAAARQGAWLSYEKASDGGLSARMDIENLWAPKSLLSYGSDGFLYLAPFAWILLAAGAFNPLNRRVAGLFLAALLLLTLLLDNVMPVHSFLFHHSRYFQLFRNLHLLLPAFTAVLILLAMEHFCLFRQAALREGRGRWGLYIGIVGVLAAAAVFLLRQTEVPVTTFVSLAVCLMLVTWMWLRREAAQDGVLAVLIFAAVVIPSADVLSFYTRLAPHVGSALNWTAVSQPSARTVFAYQRDVPPPSKGGEADRMDFFYWHQITSTDASGFLQGRERDGFPTPAAFELFLSVPRAVLNTYTYHKFYLYERTEPVADPPQDTKDVLSGAYPVAVTAGGAAGGADHPSSPVALTGPSDILEVTDFDVNHLRLRTALPQQRFLVYTDSWAPGWTARVDGKQMPLYKTQGNFKGLWIPEGLHTVSLEYAPVLSGYVYAAVLTVYVAVALWLAAAFLVNRRPRHG